MNTQESASINSELDTVKTELQHWMMKANSSKMLMEEWLAIWGPVDAYVRNHPEAECSGSVPKLALRLLRERDALVARLSGSERQEPAAWKYRDESWFDGNRWYDAYAVTVNREAAFFKDKNAIPLYPQLTCQPHITDDLAYQILTLALRNGTREAFPDKLRKLFSETYNTVENKA